MRVFYLQLNSKTYIITAVSRCSAVGSVRALGAWGRKFESCHLDQEYPSVHPANRSSAQSACGTCLNRWVFFFRYSSKKAIFFSAISSTLSIYVRASLMVGHLSTLCFTASASCLKHLLLIPPAPNESTSLASLIMATL